ncbi:M48 family metallopeptidase [Defluviimonas sp. SAOS-178_SWC]|uniref:M48 family metallopeptidase n=1 Tax=Defluviimonas sp. SAOS-178_SWC TaxID=3121287 RepID=UPI0032213E3B
MKRTLVFVFLALSGCVEPAPPVSAPSSVSYGAAPPVAPDVAASNFMSVVARMEPVIERECRARSVGNNCDFRIVVDDRPRQPPNAYQTLDPNGRPIIAFTLPLIAEARNEDEIAFVLGHEAAHHIAEHIPRQRQTAMTGALVLGVLTAASGGDPEAVRSAQDLGGTLGARRYAKDFELEADALGTILAWDAGYDPERGAVFFTRIPDPGNQFLGTHPPNASRIETVRRTLAGLR